MHPSNREEKVPPIYRVPVEVLLLIAGQLGNIKDLNALSGSCKAFHNYIAHYRANSSSWCNEIARQTSGGLHLHEAIKAGNNQLFILLVWRGVDLNERNHDGYTALHLLASRAFWNLPTIISVLIKHGADPNAIDAEGKTPLHHACFSGPGGSVNALLAHSDTNRNARCAILGWTPLHFAVYNWGSGSVEAIHALLADPTVDPSISDITGRTPLHLMYQIELQFTPAEREIRGMIETVPGNSAALDLLGLAAHQYSLPQNRALNRSTFGVLINDIVRRHCRAIRSEAIYSLLSRVRDMQTSAPSCLDLRMPLSSADAMEMHTS